MDYAWAIDLHDKEGSTTEQCLLVFVGNNTIIKFRDSVELEQFAYRIIHSLKEIEEQVNEHSHRRHQPNLNSSSN